MAQSSSRGVEPVRFVSAALCIALVLVAGPVLEAIAPAHAGENVLFVVRRVALALAGALLLGGLFVRTLRSQTFAERFVAPADASDLAVLRVAVALVTACTLAFEPVPTTTLLPASLYEPVGLMALLEHVPGFALLRRSELVLYGLWIGGVFAALLAAIGIEAKRTVPVAAVLALLCGGLVRGYTHVFHLGMLSPLLLLVLAFTPCADALVFGVDVRPSAPGAAYAYGRFVVVANMALAYAAAGFSKLVRGGTAWWDARNMHRMLFESSLDPMPYSFDVPLHVRLPDALVSSMGLAAVMLELAMPLVLLRGLRGRPLLPLLAIGMHVGILLCQNIFFPDLIVLDAVLGLVLLTQRSEDAVALDAPAPRYVPWLVGVPLLIGLAGIEAYPLTAWPMFSTTDTSGIATYHRLFAETSRGRVALDVAGCYPALHDTRYRDLMRWSLDGARAQPSREAFMRCARMQTDAHPDRSPIRRVVVERLRYDFVHDPDHPMRGDVTHRLVLPVTHTASLFASRSQP